MMNSEGQVITPKAFCPGYLPSMLAKAVSLASSQRSPAQRMWLGGMLDSAVEVLKSDVPVAVPFHPNFVYGHFLLEMLPKLLVLDQLHQMGAHFPIAMSTHTPAWARQIVSDLWRNRTILWYDSEKQVVRAPALILPSGPAVGHAMHPAFSSIDHFCARRLGMALPQQSTCASGRLIYLSRTKMPVTWHRIENEQEIETAFSELGFEIIHPQELSFCQQIELMASARVVAGEFSSALHNTLFAPIGTPVIALNWINWYQSRACALRQQPLAIVLPTDSNVRDHRSRGLSGKVTFSVDPTSVRQIVARVHELYCSP
jgi:O-antigen biosynthesis protein WbqL